jgi:TatD DNase family protein
MHCFAGDLPLAIRYIEIGFVISIAGTCTYPNAERTRAVARGIPLRWMAVETDAPYLPPQSQRGHRNEPAYLVETVKHIAELRGETFVEVAAGTATAAARLFGFSNIGEPAVQSTGERP